MSVDAERLIELLGLQPHPEGGWWAQTWRGPSDASHRPQATAIVYLLRAADRSSWHRLDVTEVWHHHRGATVVLRLWAGHGPVVEHRLGADIEHGDRPQVVVPAGWWQTAAPDGGDALVGCTMGPGFWLDGWELAPPGWEPGAS
jgi:predicted cupin superfamily sugar epimerase